MSYLPQVGDRTASIHYDSKSQQAALNHIDTMLADHGGTNIVQPLKMAQEWPSNRQNKRVFLLTDGHVRSVDAVVEQAKEYAEQVRVFTFGLGSGCDTILVRRTAEGGRGTASIVADGSTDLNG